VGAIHSDFAWSSRIEAAAMIDPRTNDDQQDPGIRKFYKFLILKIKRFKEFKISVPFSENFQRLLKKARSKNLLKISKMSQQVAFFKQRLAFFQQKFLVVSTTMAKCHQRQSTQ
jgi:hypothetical protein